MKSEGGGIVISASHSICCGEGRQKRVSAYLPQATLPARPTWQICLKFWNLQHQRPKDDFATASEGQKISDGVCLVRSDFFKAVQSCFNDMGTSVCACLCACMFVACTVFSIHYTHACSSIQHMALCQRVTHLCHMCEYPLCVIYMCVCAFVFAV